MYGSGREEHRRLYRMPETACRSLGTAIRFPGTLPRPKKVSPGHFFALLRRAGLSSPAARTRKSPEPLARGFFWCERWDSNPHGVTTRTSNVLVYHSNTLANAWLLYSGGGDLSTVFFCAELQKIRKNFVFVL